jgi:hypothetical protein
MPKRKRRGDKHVHSNYLFDVLVGLVDSSDWKEKLLQLEPPNELAINAKEFSGQDGAAAYWVRRYQLSYVLTLDVNNEIGDPDLLEGARIFKLQSSRHPMVYGYIEEMPEDIGMGEGIDE